MQMKKSLFLFEEAKNYIPGGVNSPVRAFKAVGGNPCFIHKGNGSKIWDVEGNEYIDYVLSWGPLILGHSHPKIVEAIKEEIKKGTSYGAPTEIEVKLAKLITEIVPSIEMVRMVNSGTEATMSAIRLARAYTRREKIIKFEGCYHGHSDSFLIKAGSGALTFGMPDSPGVTKGSAIDTLVAKFNDLNSVKNLISENKGQIAAVILEPIAGNMGCIPPEEGFLKGLREITANENILLIFDEIITGFRVSLGGAQELYKINPDLTTLGKIIGGGFPVGAYGGKKEIMRLIAPEGPVYQAGTLSGNPVAMRAGYETLKILKEDKDFYKKLDILGKILEEGIIENMKKLNLNFSYNRIGSMSCLFFTEQKVKDLNTAKKSDLKKFSIYFHEMLKRGIYLPPSQFETIFISIAHSEEDIEKTIQANFDSLKTIFA
ncbi:glutamate-1-semialdehyde 2,1-aminomutase [Candidatus Aminicenantes bacterium AC-708-M15]|nr:glutamate-1-semialdehyde 2,1-aminomutase [SCandidatus Aminicenantes bacterium Aminicenantia_JdfR_composite]MCP2604035.1 glutamate-1-semialdehyde 2,1-aminomutase [Candidatus Aminicenantes bacterium AC-708-M15]MCP2618334.1 glutamate-1-semialdehyde 2,1-aminomutase [Candidatus Aminicenantes bacterium AC-335-A11]